MLFENRLLLNEVMTPKQDDENIEEALQKFADKYNASIEKNMVICITDNPMGLMSFNAIETLEETAVSINPEQICVHLNTFHTKDELTFILESMIKKGMQHLLVVSGDGNEKLHRLTPEELNVEATTITSVELMKYIKREYPGKFCLGCAFNHYEPQENERHKLQRKIEAGAEYIITQPLIRKNDNVDWLKSVGVPVFVEAWMTKKIEKVAECVGYELPPEDLNYDPIQNYLTLKNNYPEFGVYFAMLGMKKQIEELKLNS